MATTKLFSYPVWNLIRVDRESPIPIYEQIFVQIRHAIVTGQIAKGARLPPSRSMAQELGMSRNTIVQVYELLANEGYLQQRVGAGTFVETVIPEDHLLRRGKQAPTADANSSRPSARGQALLQLGVPAERLERYDLSPGVPALDEFPYETFAQISGRHWRAHTTSSTGYAFTRGVSSLSQQIATYLGEARGVACEPERILIISSTLQAALLTSQVLADQGDGVIVEDPCPITQVATFVANGLVPLPVPIDDSGLNIDIAKQRAQQAGIVPRLVAASPVGQFPFGASMTAQRREALLDWATGQHAWIFEDDFNSEIRWAGQPLPPLFSLDGGHRVIYASSFNRILAPGLRLAYMIVPRDLVETFSIAQRIYSCYAPLPDQALVAEFMRQGHLASHLRRMRSIYRERSALLIDCLRRDLGASFIVPDVEAGLHVSIRAKTPIDDVAIATQLLRYGLDCPALSHYCSGLTPCHGFVLGFGNTGLVRIPRATAVLARVIQSALASGSPVARQV